MKGKLLWVVFMLVLIELSSFGFIELYLARKTHLFLPDLRDFAEHRLAAEYEGYMHKRHPLLGWPSPLDYGGEKYDSSGARPQTEYPAIGSACIATYGDSFTYLPNPGEGHGIADFLARRIQCRVANYGVVGYGTDQALLRFEHNQDEARVVILIIQPENIKRTLNQWRLFYAADDYWGLKPRYFLDRGELQLVPLPTLTLEQVREIALDPETKLAQYLPHEQFLPNNGLGMVIAEFPYTRSLYRFFRHGDFIAHYLRREPTWSEFYVPGHPSGSYELFRAIVRRFASLAKERSKVPLVVFIPTYGAITAYRESRSWPWDTLARELESSGLPVLNHGPKLAEEMTDAQVCDLFEANCYGHYIPRGYELTADFIYRYMVDHRIDWKKPAAESSAE
jgi:hypothetical protein